MWGLRGFRKSGFLMCVMGGVSRGWGGDLGLFFACACVRACVWREGGSVYLFS